MYREKRSQLIGLYTQYGRYLLISSSRSGTQPANLQGIWNKDLAPAWGSKYTVNINTEMNYWPAEVTNLSECAEPLFGLMQDCSETGSVVAKEHYNLDGWVLHHWESTGWSLAWKINFWARLRDGDHAYELIKLLFRPVGTNDTRYERGGGSYPNLFDAHPPFQIDGNFGAPAGIIEMLIQSHLSAIDILPALPTSLPDGKISGVCARGGFELSFIWKDRKLINVEVLSKTGKPCRLRYDGKTVEFDTTKGNTYKLNGELKQI